MLQCRIVYYSFAQFFLEQSLAAIFALVTQLGMSTVYLPLPTLLSIFHFQFSSKTKIEMRFWFAIFQSRYLIFWIHDIEKGYRKLEFLFLKSIDFRKKGSNFRFSFSWKIRKSKKQKYFLFLFRCQMSKTENRHSIVIFVEFKNQKRWNPFFIFQLLIFIEMEWTVGTLTTDQPMKYFWLCRFFLY